MAKVKIKNKNRKEIGKKQMNPFEVHINKEKMRILGKKLKNDKGLPGISRAKAIQKRKHTLLSEYKLQHKANKFMDRRIGEKSLIPEEDKIMARYGAIRAKAHKKKNIFNLADDEILTHRGQTLSEIEKFDDPRSDNEDSEDEKQTGKLDSNFVKEVHFGGGLLSNTGQDGVKTHKKLIEQLIEESKKRKAEKQKVKEATLELTEKLDTEWKDLIQLVNQNSKQEDNSDKSKIDDYDKLMRELKFEARGTVSDRLKTEDEIAKEEKEKLEKLEQERLERMKGFVENNPKANHRSADDLDDDFVYESDTEENILTYDNEGQSNVQVRAELNGKSIGGDDNADEKDIATNNLVNESESEGEEENTAEEEEESDSDDSLADLKDDDELSDDSETEINEAEQSMNTSNPNHKNEQVQKRKTQYTIDSTGAKKSKIENATTKSKDGSALSLSEKEELEKAGNELPFTFKLPESYESLIETIQNHSATHQKIILERMIKCNHPSLSEGNKTGLGLLFAYMLQYINDLFSDAADSKSLKESFKILSTLMPHIFELAHLNKENTHNSILEVIKEKHQEYRKRKKKHPGLEVLVFLKLVSLLFSTSDFRHKVVTPCVIFMEQILRYCHVKTAQGVAYGLFVCTLVLEYTALSNRYLPAAIHFLSGILHMAIPKTSVKLIKVRPPFKALGSDLVLTQKYSREDVSSKFNISYLAEKKFTDDFKVSTILLTLKLLREFKENLKNLSSNVEIFSEVENFLHRIPIELYPEVVKSEYKELRDGLAKMKSERKLQYLIMEEKRPKALRLYEPKIVEVYDRKRHKVQSREKAERDKLMHKLKKETKGALREIRRDKAFLARVKINQRIKSDKERLEKVKRIYAEAADQQSELNALDRKKKKKK